MSRLILDALAADLLRAVLPHAALGLPIILVVACLVPGVARRLLAFARSMVGRIAMVTVLAILVGWEGHVALDAASDRSQRLRADLTAATARADENARQAAAQRDIAEAAAQRERAAASAATTLQQQVEAYASELATKPARLPHPDGCRLSGDDARRLRGLGAAGARQ